MFFVVFLFILDWFVVYEFFVYDFNYKVCFIIMVDDFKNFVLYVFKFFSCDDFEEVIVC